VLPAFESPHVLSSFLFRLCAVKVVAGDGELVKPRRPSGFEALVLKPLF
jgi:hypothetical protein